MRRHACAYLVMLATARALRAAPRMMLLPGASTGRISEEEARARTGWVHWTKKEAAAAAPPPTPEPPRNRESDRAADAAPATPQRAYTLAYFQERVKARARKEALLGLVAATGRLCDSARREEDVEAELAGVLRALTEVAAERGVPLDALARRIDDF